MFFCWSFLFPERPIPDEINPLSRTQVPLLLLVYGVLSFHREVPKVKYSELAVFQGALTLVDFLPNSSLFRRNRIGQIKTIFSYVCDVVHIGSLSNDVGDLEENGKKQRFRLAKQQLRSCITLFCTFLCRQCMTTTSKYLISRFVEDVNTRQSLAFFSEL